MTSLNEQWFQVLFGISLLKEEVLSFFVYDVGAYKLSNAASQHAKKERYQYNSQFVKMHPGFKMVLLDFIWYLK